MWAPDVYDGSPTPVTGLMATGVKAAAFAAFVRVLMETFPSAISTWQPIVAGLALASMILGNLVALAQRSLKRLLAYSSVAHAGYLLVAVWPGTQVGAGSVLLYLFAYSLTSLAAFGLLAVLGRGGERDVTLDDIAGLAASRPGIAFALTVCMLSLLGFPGTFGFIGKWYIISAVVAEGQYVLPVILVLTSVLSAGYYLPVIMAMYMRPAPASDRYAAVRLPPAALGAVTLTVALVLLFGFWPGGVLDLAGQTGTTLTQTGVPIAGPRARSGGRPRPHERPQVHLPAVRHPRPRGVRAHARVRPCAGPRLRDRRLGSPGPRAHPRRGTRQPPVG
jgi:NADH-quinone oxidoreductase subunit N